MLEELKFTKEELHEMHMRMLLSGFFAKVQDSFYVESEDCDAICDNAMRMLQAMDRQGICKEK